MNLVHPVSTVGQVKYSVLFWTVAGQGRGICSTVHFAMTILARLYIVLETCADYLIAHVQNVRRYGFLLT